MISTIIEIAQRFNIYVNPVLLIIGLTGSIILIIIFNKMSGYRKIPTTYYFFVASIHDLGELLVGLVPNILVAILEIDFSRQSLFWCKIRFFLSSSLSAIPLSCISLAIVDQYLTTSRSARVRQFSSIRVARRASIFIIIVWWLNGSFWIFYRDIIPETGACSYTKLVFPIYSVIFIFGLLVGLHTIIMVTFSILTYQNLQKTIILCRKRVDRQMLRIVLSQAILVILGLVPYGIWVSYMFLTNSTVKDNNRRMTESFVTSITYTLGHIIYAVRRSFNLNYFLSFTKPLIECFFRDAFTFCL